MAKKSTVEVWKHVQCAHCKRYGLPGKLEEHEKACKKRTKKQRDEWPGDDYEKYPPLDCGCGCRNAKALGAMAEYCLNDRSH